MAAIVGTDEQPAGTSANHAPGSDEPILAVCIATAVVTAALFWLVHRALIDDAYITLSYARNLAFHLHWGLISQASANTATSPLFVMLVGGVTAIVRDTVLGLGIVVVATSVTLAWFVTRTVLTLRLPATSAVLAVALVLLNPLLLAVTGMETTLVSAIVAGLLYAAVRRRPVLFGILAGLGLLARLDLVVFVVVLAVSSRAIRRRAIAVIATAALVSGPWFVWSWVHFGSAIPDTFVIKTLQHGFGKYVFTNGPFFYLKHYPTATVVSFLTAVLGTALLVVRVAMRVVSRDGADARFDPVLALGIAGVAYYALYSALDVAAYTWYYGPVLVALSIFLALLLPETVRMAVGIRGPPRGVRFAPGVVLGAVVVAEAAVALGHGLPWTGAPVIGGNWATAPQYAHMGRQLRRIVGTATVSGPGEIGTLAYSCGCAIVDPFSDRGRVLPEIELRVTRAEPVLRSLLDVNFRNLDRTLLPRRATYELVSHSGWGRGPDVWNVTGSRGRLHFQLLRSPVDTRAVDRLTRELLPKLAAGRPLVLVGTSVGADVDDRDALAHAITRRSAARVRLDPGDVLPWTPKRRYHGERVDEVLTVASGGAIDELLSHHGTRVVAYWGDGPWSRHVAVTAEIARLAASYRAGALTGRQLLTDAAAAMRTLGPDLAVIAS